MDPRPSQASPLPHKFSESRQLFDPQSRELHAGTTVVILQANEALGRSVGVLKLTDLLTVETDRNRCTVRFNFVVVPLADGRGRGGTGESVDGPGVV